MPLNELRHKIISTNRDISYVWCKKRLNCFAASEHFATNETLNKAMYDTKVQWSVQPKATCFTITSTFCDSFGSIFVVVFSLSVHNFTLRLWKQGNTCHKNAIVFIKFSVKTFDILMQSCSCKIWRNFPITVFLFKFVNRVISV